MSSTGGGGGGGGGAFFGAAICLAGFFAGFELPAGFFETGAFAGTGLVAGDLPGAASDARTGERTPRQRGGQGQGTRQ